MTRKAERGHAPYLSVVDHGDHVALKWTDGRVTLAVMVPLDNADKPRAMLGVCDLPPLPPFATDVTVYQAGTMLCCFPLPDAEDCSDDLVGIGQVTSGGSGQHEDVQRLYLRTKRNCITVERNGGITATPHKPDPNPPLRTPACEPVHAESAGERE